MELQVWFEGIPREVCGVTQSTTCHDIIIALAQAASLTGRYALVERWRNSERALAPDEAPLVSLARYGEKANEVQFLLRRRESFNTSSSIPLQPVTMDDEIGMRKSDTFSGGSGVQDYKCSDEDLCRKLKDHLAYQEQEIEYNRTKLVQLEKELADMELQTVLDQEDMEERLRGQKTELGQLQAVNWTQLLQMERAQATHVKAERSQLQAQLREADHKLVAAQKQVVDLEKELVHERDRQLEQLESANRRRREEINRLESELQRQSINPAVPASRQTANQIRGSNNSEGPPPSGLWV